MDVWDARDVKEVRTGRCDYEDYCEATDLFGCCQLSVLNLASTAIQLPCWHKVVTYNLSHPRQGWQKCRWRISLPIDTVKYQNKFAFNVFTSSF